MSSFNAIRQFRLVSISVASFHFNPGIISSLITVVLLYTMVSLGIWQLERAEFKSTLQQKIMERRNLAAVNVKELTQPSEERRYYPVKFIGEFDTQHSFLLDNITFNGRVGYHVFTPVKVNASTAILINRGFVAQGQTRDQLPEFETPVGEIELHGLLDLPPSRTLLLAENVHDIAHWPVVLQYVDLAEMSQLLGYELYDMVLWLNQNEAGSLQYDLPVLNLNAAKNYGYAFQWFAMSAALLIIYIVVNTKHKKSGLKNE